MSVFSFYGRARRTTYGLLTCAMIVACFAFSMDVLIWMIKSDQNHIVERIHLSDPNTTLMLQMFASIPMWAVQVGMIFCSVVLILLCIAWIATCVRRLHDINTTGWLVLICILAALVPYIGYIVVNLILGFWPGTRGRNKFGPDPRRPLELATSSSSPRPQAVSVSR